MMHLLQADGFSVSIGQLVRRMTRWGLLPKCQVEAATPINDIPKLANELDAGSTGDSQSGVSNNLYGHSQLASNTGLNHLLKPNIPITGVPQVELILVDQGETAIKSRSSVVRTLRSMLPETLLPTPTKTNLVLPKFREKIQYK